MPEGTEAASEATEAPADEPQNDQEAAPTGEVVIREVNTESLLEPARYGFHPDQVEAIKRTVARDCTDAELVMFLEVCARYNLDPFAKQIYAAKIKGAVQIIVSRDGLLALAHKEEDFKGLTGDVVHRSDTFSVSYKDGKRSVTHEYAYGGASERDEIIGAWAEVRREGHESTFFFAPMEEYERTNGDTPWKHHPSSMILKVAEVYALRKAYSVSGVVGEEEMDRQRSNLTAVPDIEYGDDDDPLLADDLRRLVEEANQAVPGSYRPVKLKALLNGVDHDQRVKVRDELLAFSEHATEEAVDAEVVTDGS
jgi:phage recombination protein Bet